MLRSSSSTTTDVSEFLGSFGFDIQKKELNPNLQKLTSVSLASAHGPEQMP
jgi:hypothetical protein